MKTLVCLCSFVFVFVCLCLCCVFCLCVCLCCVCLCCIVLVCVVFFVFVLYCVCLCCIVFVCVVFFVFVLCLCCVVLCLCCVFCVCVVVCVCVVLFCGAGGDRSLVCLLPVAAMLPEITSPESALHAPGPGAADRPRLAPQAQNHHRGQGPARAPKRALPNHANLLAPPHPSSSWAFGLNRPRQGNYEMSTEAETLLTEQLHDCQQTNKQTNKKNITGVVLWSAEKRHVSVGVALARWIFRWDFLLLGGSANLLYAAANVLTLFSLGGDGLLGGWGLFEPPCRGWGGGGGTAEIQCQT